MSKYALIFVFVVCAAVFQEWLLDYLNVNVTWFQPDTMIAIHALLIMGACSWVLSAYSNKNGAIVRILCWKLVAQNLLFVLLLLAINVASLHNAKVVVEHYFYDKALLVIYLVGLVLVWQNSPTRWWQKILVSNAIVLVAFALYLDVGYRLYAFYNPFSNFEQVYYHWNVHRSYKDNYFHSSLHEAGELKHIAGLMPENSFFYSDEFTSYYLKVHAPLYAVNPKGHHKHLGFSMSKSLAKELCLEDISQRFLNAFYKELKKKNVRYVVIKKDTRNYLQSTSCFYQKGERLLKYFKGFADIVYTSEKYTVFLI